MLSKAWSTEDLTSGVHQLLTQQEGLPEQQELEAHCTALSLSTCSIYIAMIAFQKANPAVPPPPPGVAVIMFCFGSGVGAAAGRSGGCSRWCRGLIHWKTVLRILLVLFHAQDRALEDLTSPTREQARRPTGTCNDSSAQAAEANAAPGDTQLTATLPDPPAKDPSAWS